MPLARIHTRSPVLHGLLFMSTSAAIQKQVNWSPSSVGRLRGGQTYAKDLKYSPLPADLIKRIDDKLATIQLPANPKSKKEEE